MININKIYKMDMLESEQVDPTTIIITVEKSDGSQLIPIIIFNNVYKKDMAFTDVCLNEMLRLWRKELKKDSNNKWICPKCKEFDMAQLVEVAKGLKRGQDYK